MICADKGQPRKEWVLRSNTMAAIRDDFEVYSALYGDGKSRYTDVTKTVQGWTSDGLWPENWEEVLYATRKPRVVNVVGDINSDRSVVGNSDADSGSHLDSDSPSLRIHKAHYGVGSLEDIDVRERLQSLVNNDSLDIIVNNSTLTPGQNPFRGKKKQLNITYSFNGSKESTTRTVEEKDWLIIGPVATMKAVEEAENFIADTRVKVAGLRKEIASPEIKYEVHDDEPQPILNLWPKSIAHPPQTAPALNDFLIRKFSISPQRLRGPMPIELRDFHRNDLAQLFAELGFKRGAEIGVAEGNYSEVLLKANPECELLLVDPWHHYSDNPQGKSKEKHEYAEAETRRKTSPYKRAIMLPDTSMKVVADVDSESLDFVYVDGNHLFDYCVMDLIEWSKRVRSSGIVSGDDYYQLDQKRWVGGGVVEAVQAYTNAHRIPIWFLCSGHKSVDYFWCKP